MLTNPLRVYSNITEAIGFTPMIRLNKIAQENNIKCQIYCKCEFLSAGGSVKDRIGRSMIIEAEKRGTIKPGDTICEGTSGNTGIGLALTAITRGYNVIITIPDKMSNEKIDTLKALGAKVIVTSTELPLDHPDSYFMVAKRLGSQPGHIHINQYENLDNQLAHIQTTSVEIWEQMEGKIDYVFISVGTCGTVTGTGKGLHAKDKNIKIIGVDPVGSILARPPELNPPPKTYKVEGPGQSRIPGNMDYNEIHEFVKVDDPESLQMSRDLISKEGFLVGGSAGGLVAGCIQYLKSRNLDQDENLRVVLILPDNVKNYMSKLMSDNWMVGHGFYPTERLFNPEHPLASKKVSDLKNLQPIPYYDARLTVNDCFDLFKKGHTMIPIRGNGAITGVVTKNSLARTVVDKKLHGMSSVSHCTQRDYLRVPFDTSLAVISNLLKTEVAILVVSEGENNKIRTIHVVTQNELLEMTHESLKETI
jgi:cystathionine beta-synthase